MEDYEKKGEFEVGAGVFVPAGLLRFFGDWPFFFAVAAGPSFARTFLSVFRLAGLRFFDGRSSRLDL